MKKLIILALSFFVVACSSSKPMNLDLYNQVTLGTTVDELKDLCGKPIEIKKHGQEEEYIYIERLTLGNRRVVENYYSFFIEDNKVMRKGIKTQKPPAFNLIYTEDPNNPSL